MEELTFGRKDDSLWEGHFYFIIQEQTVKALMTVPELSLFSLP